MTLSPKQKLYFISGGLLIIVALVFIIAVFPLIKKIESSSVTLEKQKMVSENFYQNWKDLAVSKNTSEQIQNELSDQGNFLPKNEVLKFIMATEEMTQGTGNRQDISVTNDSPTENETTLKLRISLYGNFSNLLNFLARIENATYFNNIDSLQINRVSTKEDPENKNGNINSIINLSACYK